MPPQTATDPAQMAASELLPLYRRKAHRMARFFASYDLLPTPTLPLAAFEVPHLLPPTGTWGEDWTDWAPFSYPFNLTQQPAASLPCGFTGHGLPVGLQVVGASAALTWCGAQAGPSRPAIRLPCWRAHGSPEPRR
jgi:Asp-tRNA(Asn)/Glu-tRNA(Gln) amidotransferase A subunit family amidase